MDDPYACLGRIVVMILLLVVSSIFYGLGAALQEANRGDFEEEEGKHSDGRNKTINKLLAELRHFINTVLIIGTFISFLTALYEVPYFASLSSDAFLSARAGNADIVMTGFVVLYAFVFAFLILAIGVFAPKKIAIHDASRWIRRYVGFTSFFVAFFTPVTWLITVFSNAIVRARGIDPLLAEDDVTEEEIISMVDEGTEQGVLRDSEAEMIRNIFELDDKDAKDIMTHRKNIVAIDGNWTLNETMPFILSRSYSRFPVYEEDIDTLIGILHIRDATLCYQNAENRGTRIKDLPEILREIDYIPETRGIELLFRDMQNRKIHLAVVIDEYGQTSGLVAMEDILEEIVGNILDEYDVEENMIVRQADGSYIMLGMTPLSDIEEELKIDFNDEENETLNGFLISKLDRIPARGEQCEIIREGYRFHILTVSKNMIGRVLVTKEPAREEETED